MSNKRDQSKTNKVTKESVTPSIDPVRIEQAISAGQATLTDGKPKVEAAMVIFRMLEDADQQTVVGAFIQGANLTPMGAVTYWYNCRRKVLSERKKRSEG